MSFQSHQHTAVHQPALLRFDRIIAACCFLILTMAFDGCLIYETVDYHVSLNSDGKSGTLVVKYTNIESSADEADKQNDDFRELIEKWRGDKYLLERMNDGVYIKRRDLKLMNGILVWKEVGIFSDVQKMKDGISFTDTTRIAMGRDETVLATNGVVLVSKDSTIIEWPPNTRDFQIKIQNRDFKPSSHFANAFKKLKK